jgi:hypothetical protein
MGTKAHSGAMKFTRNLNHLNRLEAADEFDVASNFGLKPPALPGDTYYKERLTQDEIERIVM